MIHKLYDFLCRGLLQLYCSGAAMLMHRLDAPVSRSVHAESREIFPAVRSTGRTKRANKRYVVEPRGDLRAGKYTSSRSCSTV